MKGWGPKVRYIPRSQGNRHFWRDIPDIPEVPDKFEKKKLCSISFPIKIFGKEGPFQGIKRESRNWRPRQMWSSKTFAGWDARLPFMDSADKSHQS